MARRKLTDQQEARIAKIQEKRRQRAASTAEASLAQSDDAHQQTGRVVVRHGRSLLIRADDGSEALGMLRANLGEVVCGDYVVWQPAHDNEGVVVAVLPHNIVAAHHLAEVGPKHPKGLTAVIGAYQQAAAVSHDHAPGMLMGAITPRQRRLCLRGRALPAFLLDRCDARLLLVGELAARHYDPRLLGEFVVIAIEVVDQKIEILRKQFGRQIGVTARDLCL